MAYSTSDNADYVPVMFLESLCRLALSKWDTVLLTPVQKVTIVLESVVALEQEIIRNHPEDVLVQFEPAYGELLRSSTFRRKIGKLRTLSDQADLENERSKREDKSRNKVNTQRCSTAWDKDRGQAPRLKPIAGSSVYCHDDGWTPAEAKWATKNYFGCAQTPTPDTALDCK